MSDPRRLAIIMACHNRRQMTLECLARVRAQSLPGAVRVEVILVDDGSTDGTAQAVRDAHPEVTVVPGDGSLYWCGGMRVAFGRAMQGDFDYYLWLNDDTMLWGSAISNLLDTLADVEYKTGSTAIVVGATVDPATGQATYGGVRRSRRWGGLGFELAGVAQHPIRCDTLLGNCVLIPRAVAMVVGNLDEAFQHDIGDLDYGNRATKAGFAIWQAPGSVGTCGRNPHNGRSWTDRSLPVRERWRRLLSPKGMPPRARALYNRRHGGALWFIHWLRPYAKLAALSVVDLPREAASRLRPNRQR